ncbi:MAG: sugar phosphate isomerase/epimerase, partial [Caldilineae bacterium]
MQFGVCTGIENAGAAANAGFDFVECTVRSLRPEEDEFGPIQAQYAAAPLPTPVFNVFVPGTIKLTGPQVEWPTVQDYVERSLARVAAVGGRQVVFGSGGARRVPEGFPRAEAEEQLVRFLRLTGDAAAAHGITIVIEPLNRRESNIINSVPEGVELAKRADHPNIQVLADLYHMMMDGEPLENVVTCGAWLKHIHVADSG